MSVDLQAPAGVDRAMQALLDLIESDRARQCERILGDARAQAQALRAQASAAARQRMRQTFGEQRTRQRDRIAAAEARLATARRLHEQRRLAAWLRLASERLPGALQALWQQQATRASWARAVLGAARTRLPQGTWKIAHPADWSVDEREAAIRDAAPDAKCRFEPDARIAAGLKVSSGSVVLDGTLEGLLADRSDVEGRLLSSVGAA